jgi:hypothetical protein
MARGPGLLVDDLYLRIAPIAQTPLGDWLVRSEDGCAGPEVQPLDRVLHELGQPVVSERHAVVCIGSNAAPAQLYAKFTQKNVRVVLPMVRAEVDGIRAGLSAHVSRPGYLPATPVADPDYVSRLVVLWLDDDQLAALDETEPNYHRITLSADSFTVTLPSGNLLSDPHCYVSRHGCIADERGIPRPLRSQEDLISHLLAEVPALRELCGTSPQEWLTHTAVPAVRERVRALLRVEGLVLEQREFSGLRTARS